MVLTTVGIAVIAAAVLSLIELGLTAYVASGFETWWGNHSPDIVNFMIFASVWSLLVCAYIGLTPIYLTRFFHRIASLALLVVTAIFWFAGSIAMAVWLGVPRGCASRSHCGSAQAAVAFGFFLWVIFTGLAVLDGMEFFRGRRSATGTGTHHHHHHHHAGEHTAGAHTTTTTQNPGTTYAGV